MHQPSPPFWRGLSAALGLLVALPALAADHAEAPGTQADPAADIDDFYAWHTGDGKIVAAITFAGPAAAGDPATYDADVLYGIHIDTDGDNEADKDVWIRFGEASDGSWGVQVTGLPGGDDEVVGPVEESLDAGGGLKVFAGLREDPFFFDLTGFQDTLSTGSVAISSARDFFAGKNVTAIVVEMDTATTTGTEHSIQLWATSSRK